MQPYPEVSAWLSIPNPEADCTLWAIDRDPDAIARGAALAARHPGRLHLVHARFGDMLESLAALRVSDPQSLDALTRLFPRTKSVDVQRAIAGVLIRADYQAMAKPEVARALRQHRLKSPDGEDLIDVLIRRLQIAS